jgi:hypothetical protein
LALRAIDDLVLRSIDELTAPLTADGSAVDIQFVSEPLSLELLDCRPYSVELLAIGSDRAELVPLGFTLFGGRTPTFFAKLGELSGAAPRTPLPAVIASTERRSDVCSLDSLELLEVHSVGSYYLTVAITLIGRSSAAGRDATLHLEGASAFSAMFISAKGDDLSRELRESRHVQTCAVWLAGLPAGCYALSVQRADGVEQGLSEMVKIDFQGGVSLKRNQANDY